MVVPCFPCYDMKPLVANVSLSFFNCHNIIELNDLRETVLKEQILFLVYFYWNVGGIGLDVLIAFTFYVY